MSPKEIDAKERIMNAVMEIMNETHDFDKITVRQIAERANVGVGLVNYHFKSRENLIQQAIGSSMGDMAGNILAGGLDENETPVERLKNMLKKLSSFGAQYSKYLKFSIAYELQFGDMQTPLYMVPVLREIFGDQKDEIELRVIALQILSAIQTVYLRSSAFQMYAGMDVNQENQRNRFIDMLVDNVVNIN